jgi:hypothetical protein
MSGHQCVLGLWHSPNDPLPNAFSDAPLRVRLPCESLHFSYSRVDAVIPVGYGPFQFSVQFGESNGTWIGSVSFGPDAGVSASSYPTDTSWWID